MFIRLVKIVGIFLAIFFFLYLCGCFVTFSIVDIERDVSEGTRLMWIFASTLLTAPISALFIMEDII